MKIQVTQILPNPHRDFNRNPIRKEQVSKLVESIHRTGFWDNLVVREAPGNPGFYEIAYGHNRMAAVVEAGITTVDLPVRDLSDWDMYLCMVDENNTQQNVTTEIVMENIGVGASLLESYIRQSETAEQFAKMVKSARSPANARKQHPDDYSRIRNSVLAGCGVGKDLLIDFVPDASKSAGVVSTVLEALYGEQRKKREAEQADALKAAAAKAAAEQSARKAEQEAAAARRAEQEAAAAAAKRQAEQKSKDEAERRQRQKDADAAERRAEQARQAEKDATAAAKKAAERHQKAEQEAADHDAAVKRAAREFGVAIEILRSFSSPTVMAEFAMLVKRNRIPEQFHVACAEACHAGEWSKMTMRGEIPKWWDVQSGEAARRYARTEAERKTAAQSNRYKHGDLDAFVMSFMSGIQTAMIRRQDVIDHVQYASPVLRANLVAKFTETVAVLNQIIAAASDAKEQPYDFDAADTNTSTPMLTHQK
jgi:ParB/RepB/Spo0J family partition protein